jgi:molybdopterin molybdotransferase
MISVEEADKILYSIVFDARQINMPLYECTGRYLAQDLLADQDLPPFNRVMMDGIAVKSDDYFSGIRVFQIVGLQKAGDAQRSIGRKNACLEVMTGCVCPLDAEMVIPYENIATKNNEAEIISGEYKIGQNIHLKGSDKKKGDLLVHKGQLISAAEIGIAASLGIAQPLVAEFPGIAIFSTGNELIPIENIPESHQIRMSNNYVIQSALNKLGISAQCGHLVDDENILVSSLNEALESNDIIVLSGGVSQGKFDLIPDVLTKLGFTTLFHKIAQKPGKPMWLGTSGKKVVFGLPGNPVSTFMCTYRYLIPWLKRSLSGKMEPTPYAKLAEPLSENNKLTRFVSIRLETSNNGELWAWPIVSGGSGDFATLSDADGFLEIPPSGLPFQRESVFKVWKFR